jgi:hypothetical protein
LNPGIVISCDVCRILFRLDDSLIVACAEVATFVDSHSEHQRFAIVLRTEADGAFYEVVR